MFIPYNDNNNTITQGEFKTPKEMMDLREVQSLAE